MQTSGIAISFSCSASRWLTKSWNRMTSGARATYSTLIDWYGTDWLCCILQYPFLSTIRFATGILFCNHIVNVQHYGTVRVVECWQFVVQLNIVKHHAGVISLLSTSIAVLCQLPIIAGVQSVNYVTLNLWIDAVDIEDVKTHRQTA